MFATSLRALIIVILGTFAIASTTIAPASAIQWSGSNGGDDTPFEGHGF
jgi:hypothetical protein